MSSIRFTYSSVYLLSASHSHAEGLTFERVLVKSAPPHLSLRWLFWQWPADANWFYLWCERTVEQRSRFTASDFWLTYTNTPSNTNNRTITWTIRRHQWCQCFNANQSFVARHRNEAKTTKEIIMLIISTRDGRVVGCKLIGYVAPTLILNSPIRSMMSLSLQKLVAQRADGLFYPSHLLTAHSMMPANDSSYKQSYCVSRSDKS